MLRLPSRALDSSLCMGPRLSRNGSAGTNGPPIPGTGHQASLWCSRRGRWGAEILEGESSPARGKGSVKTAVVRARGEAVPGRSHSLSPRERPYQGMR